MPQPLVSVIIPVYNGERFLKQALDSVFAQTLTDYEIVCVDDGSVDASLRILTSYGSRLTIVIQANAGQGAARNAGVCRSHGTYIAFLDQDDVWYPEKLEREIQILNGKCDVVLVHSDVDTINEAGQILGVGRTSANLAASLASPLGQLIGEPLILPSAMMVRRQAFERVGMFDPGLKGYEDFDLIARLSREGRFLLVKQSGVRYRVHEKGFNVAGGLRIVQSRERFLLRMQQLYHDDPGKRQLISGMLADCYSDWGMREISNGNGWEARQKFISSLQHDPLKFRTYSRLVRSFLPWAAVTTKKRKS